MATHRKLMTLLGKLGYNDEMRHSLVYHFTEGRTHSTRELTQVEINLLCDRLIAMLLENGEAMQCEQLRQRRSQVLTVATRLGIKTAYGWESFNRWMAEKSLYKKELNRYTSKELIQLLKQLHSIEYRNKRSSYHPGTKEWYRQRGGMPSVN